MIKTIKLNKKAQNQIGFAIIAMALLLLFGSIFMDDGSISKSDYLKSKSENSNGYPEESYLFYLNDTEIGRQSKVTESFPNVRIGNKEENNVIYVGNNFKLRATPFSKTHYSFDLSFTDLENLNKYLLYFDVNKISGDQDLKIYLDGKLYYKNQALDNEMPLIMTYTPTNKSSVTVTFEIDKPNWYDLFNWNSYEVNNLKVIENIQDKSNNQKEFDFGIDKAYLERVELNLVVDCKETGDSLKPITVDINDYVIADFTPDCNSRYNTITKELPLNILNSDKNEVIFKTNGYYSIAYGLNKIYFNDKETYKFTINSFNDIIDVVMYGDFDEEVIDLRLNGQTMSLERDEIISIIPYLRFGSNELKFLTKPLEIDEFIIEKNEFLTY